MSKHPADDRGSTGRVAADLMQLVARGDRGAFAALFAILAPRVKAYLMRLGCDAAQAEDLAQDVLVTVWQKAAQFDPGRSALTTWVFVIARNRRINSLRRENSTVTYGHQPPELEDQTALADAMVARWQDDVRMREAIAALPQDQQDVIRCSFFEEQPHSAIARTLGLPLGTVKSRLRIAFAKLRAQLEDFQ